MCIYNETGFDVDTSGGGSYIRPYKKDIKDSIEIKITNIDIEDEEKKEDDNKNIEDNSKKENEEKKENNNDKINEENNTKNKNETKDENNSLKNNDDNKNKENTVEKNNTVSTTPLPNTGLNKILIILLSITIISGIFFTYKMNKYKNE